VVNDAVDGDPVVVVLGTDAVTVRVLRRTVAGRVLRFRADGDSLRDEEKGSTWDPMTGRATSGPLAGATLGSLNVTTALWYAWRSQRPDTTLWGEPRAESAPQRGGVSRAQRKPTSASWYAGASRTR
jgi:hypothetical protein